MLDTFRPFIYLYVKILHLKLFMSDPSDHVDFVVSQWRTAVPEVNVAPMQVASRLFRIGIVAGRDVERLFKQYGLTQGEFDVLATLYRAGAPYTLCPQNLIEALLLSSGAMTNRLDRLEQAGLIRRFPNPQDRRGVNVSLTDSGLHAAHSSLVGYLGELERILGPLNSDERATMATLLKKLLVPHDMTSRGGIAP